MTLKTLDTIVVVPQDRMVTLQLPPEVSVGVHRIILVVEKLSNSETEQESNEVVFQ